MDLLNNLNLTSTIIRLLLALVCGGVLGLERGIKKRPAGFRTYMLVCVASTLVMITNEYISTNYQNVDPTRMGAQVISGIGFLGAGTIIVTGKNKVKGLTTAAGLWAAACIGLTIGIGFYSAAILGGIFIFVAMDLFDRFDKYIREVKAECSVYIEFDSLNKLDEFMEYVKENKLTISEIEIKKSSKDGEAKVSGVFTIKGQKKEKVVDIIHLISKCQGTCYVEEI